MCQCHRLINHQLADHSSSAITQRENPIYITDYLSSLSINHTGVNLLLMEAEYLTFEHIPDGYILWLSGLARQNKGLTTNTTRF